MAKAMKYIAIHDETGKQYCGTVGRVASMIGTSPAAIYKAQVEGRKVSGHWIIRKEGQRENFEPPPKFPQSLLDEWDATAEMIRRCTRY